MKRIVFLFSAIICIISLYGCNNQTGTILHTDANGVTDSVENDDISISPPGLRVICVEEEITALRGTTSWIYKKSDGTSNGIESDSMHPLQAKEYMTPLYMKPTIWSHVDPFAAYLSFDVTPDSVYVKCWSENDWENYDAVHENIDVITLCFESDIGNYSPSHMIDLKNGNYIYEITAEWNSSDKYSGTVNYSFYTLNNYPIVADDI